MADLIDRMELYKAAENILPYSRDRENDVELLSLGSVLRTILDAPAADAEPAQKWISVKDRLPEDDGPVITVYHFKGNTVRYISTLSYFAFDPQPHWQHESTRLVVTHWMPLPQPPEEGKH